MYELSDDDRRILTNLKLAIELVQEFGVEDAYKHVVFGDNKGVIGGCESGGSFNPMDYATYMRKKRTHTVNGVECPAPETEDLEHGDLYFMPSAHSKSLYVHKIWLDDEKDISLLKADCVFLTAEDAIASTLAIWPKLKDDTK